jgi:DNA-binding CsgD family transcriptional regulator
MGKGNHEVKRGEAIILAIGSGRETYLFLYNAPVQVKPPVKPLSPREVEVMLLVIQEVDRGDIADRLGIAPSVVNRHIQNAMLKLGAANIVGAALRFYRIVTEAPELISDSATEALKAYISQENTRETA